MANQYLEKLDNKYTRGESCLTTHIFITFALILIIIFIYVIHLYIVHENVNGAFKIASRVTKLFIRHEDGVYAPLGLAYLSEEQPYHLCACVLIRRRWSAAPAHCVSFISILRKREPTRKRLRIAYYNNHTYDVTRLRRAVIHPNFNKGDFSNNIGLLEHSIAVLLESFEYVFGHYTPMSDSVLNKYSQMMTMVTVDSFDVDAEGEAWNKTLVQHLVTPFNSTECKNLTELITKLRTYEFCVTFSNPKDESLYYGSALLIDSKIEGFFSWGDKSSNGVPFIILHLSFFEHWIKEVTRKPVIDVEGP